MRSIIAAELERGRVMNGHFGSPRGSGLHGAFFVAGPNGRDLKIIACDGTDDEALGWEHVSVSCENRCPNWPEMSFVKELFWADDECVIQYHPPKDDYVNVHPYVLHLWKPVDHNVPTPPKELIA